MNLSLSETMVAALIGALLPLLGSWVFEGARAWRRRRVVRRALLVEAQRIRDALGEGRGVVFDQTDGSIWAATPVVHVWMHSVVVEAADVSPTIVAAFLELDGRLAALARQLEKARRAVAKRKERHDEYMQAVARLNDAEHLGLGAGESMHQLEEATEHLSRDAELQTAMVQAEVSELTQLRLSALMQVGAAERQVRGEGGEVIAEARPAGGTEALAVLRREEPAGTVERGDGG